MSLGLEIEASLKSCCGTISANGRDSNALDPGKLRHGKLPYEISLRPITNDCGGL